jgi:hypothetical protein
MADYNPFSYYYYNIIIGIIIDIIHISNINIRKTEKIFTPNNPKTGETAFSYRKSNINHGLRGLHGFCFCHREHRGHRGHREKKIKIKSAKSSGGEKINVPRYSNLKIFMVLLLLRGVPNLM